jgi:hypothetical protein
MSRHMYTARQNSSREEMALRERIRFLLPPVAAVGLMIALALTAADSLATSTSREWVGVVVCAAVEAALLANVIARRRLRVRLGRVLAGRCPVCGYSLMGNISGVCPECGTTVTPRVKV